MNARISVFLTSLEATKYLSLYNLHDYTFKGGHFCNSKMQNIVLKENNYFWMFSAYTNEIRIKMYFRNSFF